MTDEERLCKFEEMLDAVRSERQTVSATLEDLRVQNKVKTATYQQLFARKMTLGSMLALYERYGLWNEEEA